ncbi:hypothetical protein MTsPCn9_17760 [Croceitalea sp. MTPC9]|uniref:hypothetical protein n=1 Tax=unclassified Croceitalea TaxID=2632280 RepID=UPI002B3D265B|nr:hypothetical protein MTsPCn6_10610 [Croceitalea sp. MTPC6]GMN16840.1 hypothetical protein MTsPCn9_17760 [Croceitalea sp. MTPC9]
MESQDTKFNYKIILTALVAVIIAILIAFYYSYAQSTSQLKYLEDEKELLVKDLTLMKVEVDRLSGLNEVNDIELQTSRTRVQQLLDSVGRLNFSIVKLKESQKRLRVLELRFDSLKVKNNFLRYNNSLLVDKYEKTRREIQELRGKTTSLEQAEALQRQKNKELAKELKVKSYLKMSNAEGAGFRLRAGRPLNTNKASTIEKLRGCVTVLGNPNERGNVKVIYFQFLGPNMTIIEDNATTVSVGGNTYSKRVELVYLGKEISVCDAITVPEGSLEEGIYTLNVFEDERLLSSTEFQLK